MSVPTVVRAAGETVAGDSGRRWMMLAVLLLGQFMGCSTCWS